MFVAGTFRYNLHLELAISELEKKGVSRNAIAAIPMHSQVEKRRIMDTIHRADGISSFDAAALLGTFCMLMGAIYGFVLKWGPVIWGLIGLLLGAILGLLADLFVHRLLQKHPLLPPYNKMPTSYSPQVVLIIECQADQTQTIKDVLWDNLALGVGTLPG